MTVSFDAPLSFYLVQMVQAFWQYTPIELMSSLKASSTGLTTADAGKRFLLSNAHQKKEKQWRSDARLLLSQFKSPLVLLLVVAVILSISLGELSNSIIILTVLLISGTLGFLQERNAGKAVSHLQRLLHTKSKVLRDGKEQDILSSEVVPGDLVLLKAGDVIPADSLIIEANDLHVNEAVLTGEAFPVEKNAGSCNETLLSKVHNAVFKGTSVINGTATILAVFTSKDSELGKIASSLQQSGGSSTFERGITRFGYLLMRITMLFTGIILTLNVALHRPLIESVLFSLALTVGLTPELLPAILTITLASGAKQMAEKKMIVKTLDSIQNLGEMDVLCSDKTGTITEGIASFTNAIGIDGKENSKLLLYAFLNASFETGFVNPIDEAIRRVEGFSKSGYEKKDEVPYDFIRKRLSIVVGHERRNIMITKGALKEVLQVCSSAEDGNGKSVSIEEGTSGLLNQFDVLSREGYRVIALATKDVTNDPVINKDDENDMTFLGFLVFSDPLKNGIIDSVNMLRRKGISLKIITGDNPEVARHVASTIGLNVKEVLTGADINRLSSDALARKVEGVDVYAEILPAQKEHLVKALKKAGHSVGYMGDGINDANALKAADVGISMSNAVDVAREAADLVLLDKNLNVISDGVEEGRKTFQNTMKYILMTTSANFGNMFSMAIASLLLPFLPLLPVQILLNNFLSDLPAIAIASDNVDEEMVAAPQQWDIAHIRRFMIVFGLLSSLFDFITFGLLYFIFRAPVEAFRTAWFMESLLTEILMLLIIRSKRPFLKSRPSKYLLGATAFTFLASFCIPYLPFAGTFQFTPLSLNLFVTIIVIVLLYSWTADLLKRSIFTKIAMQHSR